MASGARKRVPPKQAKAKVRMMADLVKRLAVLGVASLTLAGCAALGTTVAEDDPETEVPNVSMGRALMEGLGAVPARRQPIDFSPRAPLVVPPTTTALVAPQTTAALADNADWPVDPDLAAARRMREAAAREAGRDPDNEIVPGSELLAVRVPPADRSRDRAEREREERRLSGQPLRPSEIGSFAGGTAVADNSLYNEAGQPRRRALTEPPVEYLQPAPGAPVAIPEEPSRPGLLQSLKFW